MIRLFSSGTLSEGMVALIPYEGSFSLSAYSTGPGWQSIVPQGYVYYDSHGERYIAPLVPELFYGVSGQQLQHTWRQYIPSSGEHTILSRVGGNPQVPRGELNWRKLEAHEARRLEEALPTPWWIEVSNFLTGNWLPIVAGIGAITGIVVTAYYVSHW